MKRNTDEYCVGKSLWELYEEAVAENEKLRAEIARLKGAEN